MTLTFQNPGEIDILAATTFGINAKATDNPIGYFGTGMKYAIAIILRNGGKVTIWSGKKKFNFGLQMTEVRGQEFQVITMNRKAQGWTTRMGINWQPWQAFRELYCNAKDEGGFATNRRLEPEAGKTTILVTGWDKMVECFEKRSAFFLEGEPLHRGSMCEVFRGASNGIYYRGILVGQLEKATAFTYNITSALDLTEDRTLKYPWQANGFIVNTWLQCDKPHLIEDVLTADREGFEHGLNYAAGGLDPSSAFLDTVGSIRRGARSGLLNDSARDVFEKMRLQSGGDPEEVELTSNEHAMLDVAWRTIRKLEVIPNPERFRVHVCNSLGSAVLGKAYRGKIFISRRAFEWGQDTLTGTIFEELCHVALDMHDNTRDFQNFLINQIARLGAKL